MVESDGGEGMKEFEVGELVVSVGGREAVRVVWMMTKGNVTERMKECGCRCGDAVL